MGEGTRDEAAVRRVVETMAMTLADWGFPRMPARVLMAMTAADEKSLTAGELAERLEVSPAAISGAVRYLIQLRLLVREPVPGSRRDHYRMPDDPWYEATAIKGDFFRHFRGIAEQAMEALGGPGTPSGARVADMRDFFIFMEGELDGLMAKWHARRQVAPEAPQP